MGIRSCSPTPGRICPRRSSAIWRGIVRSSTGRSSWKIPINSISYGKCEQSIGAGAASQAAEFRVPEHRQEVQRSSRASWSQSREQNRRRASRRAIGTPAASIVRPRPGPPLLADPSGCRRAVLGSRTWTMGNGAGTRRPEGVVWAISAQPVQELAPATFSGEWSRQMEVLTLHPSGSVEVMSDLAGYHLHGIGNSVLLLEALLPPWHIEPNVIVCPLPSLRGRSIIRLNHGSRCRSPPPYALRAGKCDQSC
jgi:hypothetical protein